jgi:competence protein ComEC
LYNDKTISSDRLPNIKIAFLDVGQGDTTIISCPETQEAIVVDCINAKAVKDYLVEEHITHLSGIIVTHLHADHYSGVPALLKNYLQVPNMEECKVVAFNKFSSKKFQKLMDDDDKHSSSMEEQNNIISTAFQDLIKWHEQNDTKYTTIQVQLGSSIPYHHKGTLIKSLDLLHPSAANITRLETKGLNNTSVVLRISGPASSALLTSDLEPVGWQQLVSKYSDLHSDVLKFPHHGGAWKDTDINNLLDAVDPSIVIISVGSEGQRYNHPNPSVFEAISKRPHIRLLCTQATNQCRQSVIDQQTDVTNLLKVQVSKSGRKLIGSKHGCPCAGTVIIELKEKTHVLQPEIQFHQEFIIKPHFTDHKCNLLDDPAKIQNKSLQQPTDISD